ncbi:uncharacterized protein [Nerophis lumbriciformis]|uniref:uncharacterized protein n=1 Tax=Nerophis lumbriciformis TaxID=546530 RepID=UPI002AE04AAC|nr:zinc finger protein 654-like [Nerophis lumbriciformis]
MAEEGSVVEAEGLEKQLQTLICHYSSDELRGNSKRFCLDYCELVEENVSRWQMPLPRLRILEKALCHFARASCSFTSSCDHVLRTLSSLALSVFELLLFFDEKDFPQEPLKCFRSTFQECHLSLARYQNAHLLQVDRLVQAGGAWASTTLQAILSDSNLPQDEVDACLSSELPVFFELRVRYLLSCERVTEALALAKYCIRHPTTGQHSFFLKVYLTWLYKSSQHDRLREELADLSSKDAVHIICNLEYEESNELLLALCQMFLSQKLCRGDLYYMCELVFVWSKLHTLLNTSKQALFEESRQLMLCATNVNSIFPFIRVVLQELGEDGLQFCVELCANALKSCLPCDAVTKSLIYKTIAGLLHNDLEVCRACALLVFFMERSLEAYKMVYLHYMLPDQEYPVEHSPVSNQIRFETLQVLKKDLYFDPEFWNLITLRTNCLKLMSKKVVDAALEEIVEEKWITNYCSKEFSSTIIGERDDKTTNKRNHKEGSTEEASKRLKFGRLTDDSAVKKKGNHGPQYTKRTSSQPLRRSFWQLDSIPDVANGQLRRATRLSDKNPPKRIIQKPKWLLEDSATLQESKRKKQNQSSALRKPESGQLKNNSKPKVSVNSCITHQRELHPDSVKPSSAPQVILELSLPDNELMGTFNEDTCNRQKGYPQMLYYKPTVKIPDTSQPGKVLHGKEVILRARDLAMFVQQLHCYAQGQKGKGNGSNIHGSVSTITRSSAHGSPPKEPQRGLCEEDNADTRGVTSLEPLTSQNKLSAKEFTENRENKEVVPSQKSVEITESIFLCTTTPSQSTDTIPHTMATSQELYEEPSVEMKVTFASQSPAKDKATQQPTQAYTELSQTFNPQSSPVKGTEQILPVSSRISVPSTGGGEALVSIDGEQQLKSLHPHSENGQKCIEAEDVQRDAIHTHSNNLNDISTLGTEMDTQFPLVTPLQDTENHKKTTAAPIEVSMSVLQNKHNVPNTSSRTVPEPAPSASMQCKEEKSSVTVEDDDGGDDEDFEEVESEESGLEYCCTFCQKVFKGRRVVVHAMFHFRKDECMFCGTMFKDDLLAMMHLSDHIEKLKRSKECAINKAEQERVSETKDLSAPKSSAKAKGPNRTSGNHSSRTLRKPPVCSKTIIQPVGRLSESRSLRSMTKPGDGQSIQKHKQNDTRTASKSPAHRSNGYLDKKSQHDQIKQATLKTEEMQPTSPQVKKDKAGERKGNHDMPDTCGSLVPSVQKRKHLECSKNNRIKDTRKIKQKKKEAPLEKLHCPADGCNWSTDLSKKRVALLYHALEHHYGDIKPLELSFQVANNKCSICMRVLWSFEHFQHHVERHRLCPRHPCLHLGCTSRFKSGMEMRRHTRKHSPLQAVCCFPGCSELFICLWALNLHEREHYASKRTKPIKSVDLQMENKPNSTKVKQIDGDKPNAATMTTEETLKEATRKLRGHASHNTTGKHVNVPPPNAKVFVVKQQLKVRKESKDSNVLKNLSNKASTTSAANYRLNLRVRKWRTTKANPMVANTLKSPFPGHKDKLRHRLRKKEVSVNAIAPRKRGRPPKSTKATHDENKTAGKNSESPKDKTPQNPLACLVGVSSKLEIKEKHFQDASKTTTEISHLKSVSKKSLSEDTKSNRVEQNKSSDKDSNVAAQNSVSPTENSHKLILHNLKKLCASKATDSSGASKAKKQKLTTKTSLCIESKIPVAKSTFVVPKVDAAVDIAGTSGDDHGNEEKTLSSQDSPADCPPATAKSGNQKHTAIKKKSQSSEGKLIRKKGGEKKVDGTTRLNLKRKSKEEPLVATSESTSSTMTNVHAKKPQHSLSASKKNNSSKDVQIKRNEVIKGLKKESKTKTAQREHPHLVQNISTQLATESKTEVKADPVKSCAGGQEHLNKTPECAGSKHHHFLKPTEDEMSTLCIDTLAEYGKKHMRAPPTAYLDEKFITMPKRRQGVSFIHSSDMTTLPVKNRVTAVPQRQRCANCFTTYSSAKELQSHLKLQRCSSLFGFDSDDEGNS